MWCDGGRGSRADPSLLIPIFVPGTHPTPSFSIISSWVSPDLICLGLAVRRGDFTFVLGLSSFQHLCNLLFFPSDSSASVLTGPGPLTFALLLPLAGKPCLSLCLQSLPYPQKQNPPSHGSSLGVNKTLKVRVVYPVFLKASVNKCACNTRGMEWSNLWVLQSGRAESARGACAWPCTCCPS